jgi:hypothetical protein
MRLKTERKMNSGRLGKKEYSSFFSSVFFPADIKMKKNSPEKNNFVDPQHKILIESSV